MSISTRLFDLIRKPSAAADPATAENGLRDGVLQDDQRERLEHDRQILEAPTTVGGDGIQRDAEKQLREAAELSLRRLHVIQRGRCPQCGEHLRQHLFASVCDTCGWHAYDAPRQGGVRVHLTGGGAGEAVLEGERCYLVKEGSLLLLRDDVVVARIQPSVVGWIEYVWPKDELDQRHKEVLDLLTISCGWCEKIADPDSDGFHMVQVAFGANQERYCFCGDDCYEAFRKMYPSRVHRNCYERSCHECDLCVKRYEDEAEGIRTLAKDFLREKRR